MTVNHPHFGTMCCICFTKLTPELCAEDEAGQKWDVCKGECAQQAGMTEKSAVVPVEPLNVRRATET